MKKTRLLSLFLLFLTMLMFNSCRTDDLQRQDANQKGTINSQIIRLNELKKNSKLIEQLQKLSKLENKTESNISRIYTDSENGFSVDLDDVLYTEDPYGAKTYTFKIIRDKPKENLENLVMVQKEDGFETFIFEYEKEIELNYLKSNRELKDAIREHVTITNLGKKTDVFPTGKMNYIACEDILVTWVETPGTPCASGLHSFGDGDACIYWGTINMAFPSYGGHYEFTFTSGNCGVSDGGGGGGGTIGTTGPHGGGGGGWNGGIFTNLNNPCAKIKTRFADTKFKEKYDKLTKTIPATENVFDLDRELAVYMRYPTVGSNVAPAYVDVDLPACATDGNLPSFEEGMAGLMHTHNNESCNGGTPIKAPSPIDIKTFINVLIREAMQYTGSYANAYSVVTTSGGNYMLMYSSTDYPGSISGDLCDKLTEYYTDIFQELYAYNENVTQTDIEKLFTKFMKEKINKPGLDVYRVTPTSAVKIEYDTTSPNKIKETPCP